MAFCVGLTGGIGCGKTKATEIFAELGAGVVDTDVISRELTGPGGEAMSRIAEAFGAEYVAADGSLDRSRMRARSRLPSSRTYSRPKVLSTWAIASPPGAVSAWEIASVSTTRAPSAANMSAALDLPLPMPPVRPTQNIRQKRSR